MLTFEAYLAENRYRSMTFYHGTNSDFDEFDPSMMGRTDPGFVGAGFYLTAIEGLAKGYAQGSANIHGGEPVVLKFKVSPKKTLELDGTGVSEWNRALKEIGINTTLRPEEAAKELQKLGYDSIAAWHRGSVKEFVVLDSRIAKRIK